jgi:hypothetical protein
MRLKTILNRVAPQKSFVYGRTTLASEGGRLALEVEMTAIEALEGKLARCDLCGMPSRVEPPRHKPMAVAAMPRPLGACFPPWAFKVEVASGPTVAPVAPHYILVCPRHGARSIKQGTMVEEVPES